VQKCARGRCTRTLSDSPLGMNLTDATRHRLIDWPALVAKFGGDERFAFTLLGIAQRSNASMPAELRAAALGGDLATVARLALLELQAPAAAPSAAARPDATP
jgi:hypothetical protein